ncbi:MAG: hypothetical protein II824_10505 [Bacteroidales bacterium]|nr:hypothetical protein [Bacteroidales bacterium]
MEAGEVSSAHHKEGSQTQGHAPSEDGQDYIFKCGRKAYYGAGYTSGLDVR